MPARQRSYLDEFRFFRAKDGTITAHYAGLPLATWTGDGRWRAVRGSSEPEG